jgi:creatinine amidohydrolase/Fe(II)-dependent formamide hydrolase-like protein
MPDRGATLHHPFSPERFLPYLTTTDVATLDKDEAAVILPLASIEQHGPHLPLVTDSLIGEMLIAQALELVDPDIDLWVLPPLRYGKSNEHGRFPGTITLSAATLAATIHDIADSVHASGFRRLILANGHGGNPGVLENVARDVREKTGLIVFPLTIFRLNLSYPSLGEAEDEWGIHAGMLETSLLLELAPELVHNDRTSGLATYPHYPKAVEHLELRGEVTYAWLAEDISRAGNMGDPGRANVELGGEIRSLIVPRLAEVLAEMATFEMPVPGDSGEVAP